MKHLAATLALLAALAANAVSVTKQNFGDLGMNDKVVTAIDLTGIPEDAMNSNDVKKISKAVAEKAITDNVTKTFVENLGIDSTEHDPAFVNATNNGMTVAKELIVKDSSLALISGDVPNGVKLTEKGIEGNWRWYSSGAGVGYFTHNPFSFLWTDFITSESDPTVPNWAKQPNPPASMPDNGLVLQNSVVKTKGGTTVTPANLGAVPTTRKINTKPLNADITLNAADVGAFSSVEGATLQTNMQMIAMHINAEDARVVITNYDSAVEMPQMKLEYKVAEGGSNYWKSVWNEMTRWNWLTGTYLPANYYNKGEIDAKVDHIPWGVFDSQTGAYAPDKTVQISADRVILCKGAGYQRTATAEGDYFVWTSNEPYTLGQVNTNGIFRLEDSDGNTTFEVVRGDKVTAAATAGGVSTENIMGVTHLIISYPILADSHPTLEICNDLTTHYWKIETDPECLANVSWTGSSGAYQAEVWGKAPQTALFVKGTYEAGSDPYIRYAEAIALQRVKIGNVYYYVGTAVIDGHTVMTLSTTPPAP